MKRARIAIGVIIVGSVLAVLASWPTEIPKYREIPTTIPPIIYDKVKQNKLPIRDNYTRHFKEERLIIATK